MYTNIILIESIKGLWLTPQENLHMTTSELLSSCSESEVDEVSAIVQPTLSIEETMSYTLTHSTRLIRPVISYDATAFALIFVPAAEKTIDAYTYHHLRRDMWDIMSKSECQIGSRYYLPSAHVTIARFAIPPEADRSKTLEDLCGRATVMVKKIESINQILESTDWKQFGSPSRGEWVVGHERGLEFNKGCSWYGGGEAVYVGQGF